jgi:hypothetical protein
MTEEKRLKQIKENAMAHVENWLEGLKTGDKKEEDLISSLFAAGLVADLYGYDVDSITAEAKTAAKNLLELVRVKTEIEKNKDENAS